MPQTTALHRNFTAKPHSSHHFFFPRFPLTLSIHTRHPINTLSSPHLHPTSLPFQHFLPFPTCATARNTPFYPNLPLPSQNLFPPILPPISPHETYPTHSKKPPQPKTPTRPTTYTMQKFSTSLTSPSFFTDRRFYAFTLLRLYRM